MAFGIPSITARQLACAGIALLAFVPVMLVPGYLAAWFSGLHGFRQRSLVGRLMWSLPLSLAISTILSDLIGHFFSMTVAAALFPAATVLWLAIIAREALQLRRSGSRWNIGWQPRGTVAILLVAAWTVLALSSLVDIESHGRLFPSVVLWDMGPRVSWTEAVLRSGVPPANPMYYFHHAVAMRQYYFWYVLCAVVARFSRLPVRAIFIASSIWSGLSLASLIGLYLREFLQVGDRLRSQFVTALALLAVSGLDLLPAACQLYFLHSFTYDLEWWSMNQITSWVDSLLCVPHHIAGLVCCMLAFLLAWMVEDESRVHRCIRCLLIAAAMASAFGLSIYVAFGFFVLAVAWGAWQLSTRCHRRSIAVMAVSGALAAVLLLPYLWELANAPSYLQGGSVFSLTVREMIRVEPLVDSGPLRHLAEHHPLITRNVINAMLLVPGYFLELGFYLIVLLIFLVPGWRPRGPLTAAQRTLLFFCAVDLPLITFVRSSVLSVNDFGWRAALLLQFPLLLLGAQLIDGWRRDSVPAAGADPPGPSVWLRKMAAWTIILGVLTTATQVLGLRFILPILGAGPDNLQGIGRLSRIAFISARGYSELNRRIGPDSIVQFNPYEENAFFSAMDQMDVDHQVAIAGDGEGCGSELGGDPRGCPGMAAALDNIYHDANAEQARSVCRELGIHYLIARVYDPAWKDNSSWVWTLPPVVAQDQFRALDCQR